MGNKQSKKRKSVPIQQIQQEPSEVVVPAEPPKPSQPQDEYFRGEYKIIPSNARFLKLDMVDYGEVFDGWKEDKDIRITIPDSYLSQMSMYSNKKWYLNNEMRRKLWAKLRAQTQFPLSDLIEYAVNYNQTELLEFLCTQELIEIDYWTREFWMCVMYEKARWASKIMKTGSLRVFASYMIPERIDKKDFETMISKVNRGHFQNGSEKQRHEDVAVSMIAEGMNGRANRIIETRNALRDNVDADFPRELIGVVIAYAFGMFHKK